MEKILLQINRVPKNGGKLLARVNSINDAEHGANDGVAIDSDMHFRQTVDGSKRFFDRADIENGFAVFGKLDSVVEKVELYGARQKAKVLWEISAVSDKTCGVCGSFESVF